MSEAAGLRDAFERDGFVVARGVLDPEEVAQAVRVITALIGATGPRLRRAWLRRAGVDGAWTLPDGVTRTPELWPLITHARLLEVVRLLLGPDARWAQHSDLHSGFSAVTFHRDSVSRRYPVGPDWDEGREPYALVRVAFYLHGHAENRFRLALVPGSQRRRAGDAHAELLRLEGATRFPRQVAAWLGGRNALQERAVFVAVQAGDALLFDPRTLHAGTPAEGPKLSAFVAYGVPNAHFRRHVAYYRHTRRDLGYGDPPPELVARLRQAALWAEPRDERPRDDARAWVPSYLHTLLARTLRR